MDMDRPMKSSSLLDLVRDALFKLYDYRALSEHPLASRVGIPAHLPPRQRMRQLRELILTLVEELDPGPHISPSSPSARSYHALVLRYIEGRSITEIAEELSISERQVYRDLRLAEENLCALFDKSSRSLAPPSAMEREEPAAHEGDGTLLTSEIQRISASSIPMKVSLLFDQIMGILRPLAEMRGVAVSYAIGAVAMERETRQADLLRQALISTASRAIQKARPGSTLRVAANVRDGMLKLEVTFTPEKGLLPSDAIPAVASKLASQVNGECLAQFGPLGTIEVSLLFPEFEPYRVLIIDDNEGLLALFSAYLMGTPYEALCARDADEGLALIQKTIPDAIVLDIMMAGQDGWLLLQKLTNGQRTHDIPIIVCSVIDDPELAFALGAKAYLKKPASRQALLQALDGCFRGRSFASCPESPGGI